MSPQGLCSDANVLPCQFGAVGTTIEQVTEYCFELGLKDPDAELIWKCVNLELLSDVEKLIQDPETVK